MDAAALFRTACQARQNQDIESAIGAIDDAQRLAPDDPQIAAVRALLYYESWRPSSDLFAHALALNPEDMQLRRNQALALVSEGERDAAEALLERELQRQPVWSEGHSTLSRIRLTAGDAANYDRSFADACARQDGSFSLHLAWFHQAALIKDWDKVRSILAKAELRYPGQSALRSARFYLAAESGDEAGAEAAYGDVANLADPGLDLCKVRYHLRKGHWGAAEECARRYIGTPVGAMFWPYLSLIWRVTDNALAHWLDGAPPYLSVIDLDVSSRQVSDLADVLRRLHILQAPYPEQSVRGGTQTDRPLFFHPDPAVQAIRRTIMNAVRGFVEALPPLIRGTLCWGPTVPQCCWTEAGRFDLRVKASCQPQPCERMDQFGFLCCLTRPTGTTAVWPFRAGHAAAGTGA